jgi:hypothetical protein
MRAAEPPDSIAVIRDLAQPPTQKVLSAFFGVSG